MLKAAVRFFFCVLSFFFFFFFYSTATFDKVFCEQCIHALFMDPQFPLFSNFFIKNGSHYTIHTFKNYFATVFSVSATRSLIQMDPIYASFKGINSCLTTRTVFKFSIEEEDLHVILVLLFFMALT